MKFRKKSKSVIAITTVFSVFVCACFFITGAYAASSTTEKTDKKGSIDLRVLRDKDNSITDVEYLTESEADEALSDIEEEQHIGRVVRITKEHLSEELREIINSCDSETWYVMEREGYQYIYFGGLPYNYAYQPEIYTDRDSGTVNIFDVGASIRKTGNYVLLEIQQNVSLTINYNGAQIAYTQL